MSAPRSQCVCDAFGMCPQGCEHCDVCSPPQPAVTARSIKALVGSLREGELDLPFVACTCPPGQPCGTFAQVTATKIVVHRP